MKRGFTLIELLVVIAIIGILASVVLASLNSAREKATDAALRAELMEFAKLINLEYSETGSYAALQVNAWDTCDSYTGDYADSAQAICESILDKTISNLGNFYTGVNLDTFSYSRDWSIMLLPLSGGYICVGSSGKYEGPANPGGGDLTGTGCYNNP